MTGIIIDLLRTEVHPLSGSSMLNVAIPKVCGGDVDNTHMFFFDLGMIYAGGDVG
jgi:hypothetical protein